MRIRPGGSGGPALPFRSSSKAGASRPAASFTAILGERGVAGPAPAAPETMPKPPPAAGPVTASPVRALLERTVDSERKVDTLLAAAARGQTFSPSELLALQTTVFRYSQAVEIVSRATDKLVGAVKQTMGTQV
jgi:hypothetical protein